MITTNIKLAVVIVTYGNRWQYLSAVLKLLDRDDFVSEIVVIDNACFYDVHEFSKATHFNKTKVFRNERNLGSAAGFSKGITIACDNGADILLLLDDDNLPRENTIKGLLETYIRLSKDTPPAKLVVTAYRECQHGKFRVPLKPVFLRGHGFLSFNVFNALQRHLNLISYENIISSGPEFASFRRGGAYSGMLFAKELVQNIGLPNSDYVLYFDDIDFVIRILNAGGVVWLDVDSRIEDIVENYSISVFKTPILGFVLSASDPKIYYMIRNRSYIDSFVEKKESLAYMTNKSIFLMLTTICCILLFKWKRLGTILDACSDARRGKLGLNPRYSLQ